MLLPLSVIRPLHCEWGSTYQLGGGGQTNPNLPTIVQQKGDFNPHPARTLLRPPTNTERSASSVSLTLSLFYIHINLHLILNSPTFTQIFCSPIQFTSLGLIQKHTSFTPYTDTATPPSALCIGAVWSCNLLLLTPCSGKFRFFSLQIFQYHILCSAL